MPSYTGPRIPRNIGLDERPRLIWVVDDQPGIADGLRRRIQPTVEEYEDVFIRSDSEKSPVELSVDLKYFASLDDAIRELGHIVAWLREPNDKHVPRFPQVIVQDIKMPAGTLPFFGKPPQNGLGMLKIYEEVFSLLENETNLGIYQRLAGEKNPPLRYPWVFIYSSYPGMVDPMDPFVRIDVADAAFAKDEKGYDAKRMMYVIFQALFIQEILPHCFLCNAYNKIEGVCTLLRDRPIPRQQFKTCIFYPASDDYGLVKERLEREGITPKRIQQAVLQRQRQFLVVHQDPATVTPFSPAAIKAANKLFG